MVRITALMDNKARENKALIAEHGLSLFVEYGDQRILFDCGSGSNTLRNAHRLGISLEDLDAVILSHSHYDHAAGYRDLTECGLGSKLLYTGPDFFEPKFARDGVRFNDLSAGFKEDFLEENEICRKEITETTEVFPGVYLFSGFKCISLNFVSYIKCRNVIKSELSEIFFNSSVCFCKMSFKRFVKSLFLNFSVADLNCIITVCFYSLLLNNCAGTCKNNGYRNYFSVFVKDLSHTNLCT